MRTFLAFVSFVTAVSAHARSLADKFSVVNEAQLTQINIDPKLQLGGRVEEASIVVDAPAGKLKLTLWVNSCPENVMCVAGPLAQTIELPIVSRITDNCGAQVFTAKLDQKPVDGALQVLTVRDNTYFTCELPVRPPLTEVTYETSFFALMRDEVTTYSQFWVPNCAPRH